MIADPNGNGNTDLEKRVALLTARVEHLERLLDATQDLPEACRQHECDYYRHYLDNGPADISHAGYHVAVEEHAGICDEIDVYLDRALSVPRALEAQAARLERMVRA